MSSHGYIYLKDWDRWQQGRPENAQWHKSWNAVLRHDRYLDLTLAQRGLLHDLWALVSMSGEGRVSVARGSLERQLGVRRVSLEPLIDAGFVRVGQRATSGRPTAREEENRKEEIKPPTPFEDETNGSTPRPAKRKPPTETLEAALERHRIVRELLPWTMRERWVSDEVLDQFSPADCKVLIAAWGRSNDLRDAGQKIEEAANPRAYALAIAGQRADT